MPRQKAVVTQMPPRRNPKKRVLQKGARSDPEVRKEIRAEKKRRRNRFGQTGIGPEVVMQASGASGTDTRLPSHEARVVGNSSIAVVQQDPSLNIQVRITERSLAYLSAGVVLRAMQRGWQGSANGVHSYAAFRFLLDSFKASVSGTFPTMQSAPLWFWEMNASLLPKTERFKTGRIVYTGFNLDDGQGVSQNMALGTGPTYSYNLFWGIVNGLAPEINGYPPLAPQAAYTVADGEQAVQSLFEFFDEKGLCKRSDGSGKADFWMIHDTSAFAAVYAEMGASFFSQGGTALTLESERRIDSPMFAKFAPYQDDENLWRGYHEYHRSTGSPFYLGPRLTELSSQRQLRNKVAPIFKWFDFDEIFEILSLTLCLAIEENFRGTGTAAIPCPLTSQQVQLMLRQAILPFFSNEMALDLRLEDPAWIPFLPFVVGTNGISQGGIGTGPLLPYFIAENIRCCKRITAVLRNPRQPNSQSQMELDIVPILGRPSYAVIPPLQNYTHETPAVGQLYAAPGAEVPISLIDASAVVGPTTNYLDLNGKTQPLLVQTWNKWIQNYSGTLVSLTQLSVDRGCAALCTLPYTNHIRLLEVVIPPPPSPDAPVTTATKTTLPSKKENRVMKKQGSVKHLGLNLSGLRVRVGAAPSPGASEQFQHVAIAGSSATLGFTSEIWKYLSHWWLPIAFTEAPNLESSTAAYMVNVVEPFYVASSSAFTNFSTDTDQEIYPLLYDRHMMFASENVRAYNSPVSSEMETEFKALTAKGDGGFFTKIAGIIGESLGIHGSTQFMNSVGDMTGL